jgi:hypothetical protein
VASGGLDSFVDIGRAVVMLMMSPDVALTGSAAIAVVFVWSGFTKIRRPVGAGLGLVNLGLATRVYASLGAAAGAVELAVAGLLLVPGTVVLGLFAASALLCAFTMLLARQVWRGDRRPCFCFGESDEPLSWRGVARTGALAVVAIGVMTVGVPARPLAAHLAAASAGCSVVAIVTLGKQLARQLATMRHRHPIERVA